MHFLSAFQSPIKSILTLLTDPLCNGPVGDYFTFLALKWHFFHHFTGRFSCGRRAIPKSGVDNKRHYL